MVFFSISAVFRVFFLRLIKNAVFSAGWMKRSAAAKRVFSGLLCGLSLKFWLHYKPSSMCPASCVWFTMERGKKRGEKCQRPESTSMSVARVLFSFYTNRAEHRAHVHVPSADGALVKMQNSLISPAAETHNVIKSGFYLSMKNRYMS